MQSPSGTPSDVEKMEDAKLNGGEPSRLHAQSSSSTSWAEVRRTAELDLQMDVYATGAANIDRIASRAALLRNMFMDMANLRIDVN